jgi:hypothetical protein
MSTIKPEFDRNSKILFLPPIDYRLELPRGDARPSSIDEWEWISKGTPLDSFRYSDYFQWHEDNGHSWWHTFIPPQYTYTEAMLGSPVEGLCLRSHVDICWRMDYRLAKPETSIINDRRFTARAILIPNNAEIPRYPAYEMYHDYFNSVANNDKGLQASLYPRNGLHPDTGHAELAGPYSEDQISRTALKNLMDEISAFPLETMTMTIEQFCKTYIKYDDINSPEYKAKGYPKTIGIERNKFCDQWYADLKKHTGLEFPELMPPVQ